MITLVRVIIDSCNGSSYQLNSVTTFLFDLDGTLVDTLDLHIQSFQWILSKNGIDVGRNELGKLMGRTPQDILTHYLPQLNKSEIWDLAIEKEEHLYELTDKIRIFDHVINLLESIKAHSLKTIVISSSHRSLVNRLLSNAELTDYFDDMVSGDDIHNGKPHPEPFLKGIKLASSTPVDTIGIGDSIYDLQAMRAAQCNGIGVVTGKSNCSQLLQYSDFVVTDFSKINIMSQ